MSASSTTPKDPAVPTKTKKTKSRNGCLTCKKKRLKCGEEKPFCLNCVRKNIVCGGYSMNFKWRDFSQSSSSLKMSRDSSSQESNTSTASFSSSTATSTANTATLNKDPLSSTTKQPSQFANKKNHSSQIDPSSSSQKKPVTAATKPRNAASFATGSKRSATDASATQANPSQDSQAAGPSSVLQKALEAATLSVTGKSTQEIAIANALIASGKNPELAATIASTLNGLAESVEKKHLEERQRQQIASDRQSETVDPSSLSTESDTSSERHSDPHHSRKSSVAVKLEDDPLIPSESRHSLLSSLADVASKVPPSPPSGLSPFSVQSPSELYFQQVHTIPHNQPQNTSKPRESTNAPSPLNVFKENTGNPKTPLPFTPGNPLYEILNNSTTVNGRLDSPKLMAQLEENPSAMEQYQLITASPAYNSFFKSSFSPNASAAPSPSSNLNSLALSSTSSGSVSGQNKPTIISPSFSTLINAFTNFENTDIPSPANFELFPNSPAAGQGSSADERSLEKRRSTYGQVVMPHSLLHEHESPKSSSSTQLVHSSSPHLMEVTDYAFLNSIPKSLEPNDQAMKMLSAFDRYTCGIMSIKNGPTENPWRTHMMPLSKDHPVLLNAISAMACFHVARGDTQLRTQGMKHMKNAIVELVHGLSAKSIPPEVALSSCLALAMAEAWDRHVSTGIAHLRGARTMILQVLNNLKTSQRGNFISAVSDDETESLRSSGLSRSSSLSSTHSSPGNSDLRISKEMQFLFNAWVYFDVLARMTSDADDDDNDVESVMQQYDRIGDEKDGPKANKKRKLSGSFSLIEKFQSFNMADGDDVDPLLGVAQTLFPIIGNVATLISKVRRESKNSLSIVSKAVELKRELENWKPPVLKNSQIEDPLFDLASAVATAEAYRYSTILYLHQAVPEVPSVSSHKLAEKVLMLLASIPTSSRTCVTHIFPLLVASCEARPGEEREWVKQRWELLSSKMWIGNIDRALEVVKEVWSRKNLMRRKKEQEHRSESGSGGSGSDEEEEDGFVSLSRRISEAVNGGDSDEELEEDNKLKSWTHWTTVMKDWGWEVLLA